MQLTEQMFLDAGYRRYEHSSLIDKGSSHLLCKSVWIAGVRAYVITVYVYPPVQFANNEWLNLTFEPHMQLSKDDDSTYNISLLLGKDETVEGLEAKMQKMYAAVGAGYA